VQDRVDGTVDLSTDAVEGARVGEVGDEELRVREGLRELGRAGVAAGEENEAVAGSARRRASASPMPEPAPVTTWVRLTG